ncbi:GNAT family N-acetyltransferase [Paenibacillus beijingensis]|uniref:GCN5 family acetyltransferase n=1 Tax=Paenibacillus beijingensis TaxID=1126833 RepID=A0A0D5NKG7_9BACL|nr:GNAT family N-acetyltransferase [Paenibacillus beijingensis]AJY75507.1 GCN5 family acetyltransferase [Paenibacillus beijingensis]
MEEMTIRLVEMAETDLHGLIAKLDRELLERYPADEIFGLDFSDPKNAHTKFVIAYIGGVPAGCGAIRPLDSESVELKRVFVDRDFRKRGIAAAMLDVLENEAAADGFTVVRLETGEAQPESIGLYRKLGYQDIEPFGEYACCPSSICMEKRIG